MEQISFKLEVFEGPLDLLLHLIAKHKLNVVDIEITSLLEQYLAYIEQMKLADLEVASEFLEMAARLVYIKTVSLLPKHEEADELKRELSGELPPPASVFTPLVNKRVVSVTSRIFYLLRRLYKEGSASLSDCYQSAGDRSEVVATFLAVLELVKSKRLTLNEDNTVIYFNRNVVTETVENGN